MATKKPSFGDFVNQEVSNKLEQAEQQGQKHKEAIAIAEKVQGYKKAGRKLQAGEKRTEKVLVNFAPSELTRLREIMIAQGKQYQAIAEFVREGILNS
jgi:hypothetical protein